VIEDAAVTVGLGGTVSGRVAVNLAEDSRAKDLTVRLESRVVSIESGVEDARVVPDGVTPAEPHPNVLPAPPRRPGHEESGIHMSKKLITTILGVGLVLMVVACSSDDDDDPSTTTAAAADDTTDTTETTDTTVGLAGQCVCLVLHLRRGRADALHRPAGHGAVVPDRRE